MGLKYKGQESVKDREISNGMIFTASFENISLAMSI
jgi:hypothetical protein